MYEYFTMSARAGGGAWQQVGKECFVRIKEIRGSEVTLMVAHGEPPGYDPEFTGPPQQYDVYACVDRVQKLERRVERLEERASAEAESEASPVHGVVSVDQAIHRQPEWRDMEKRFIDEIKWLTVWLRELRDRLDRMCDHEKRLQALEEYRKHHSARLYDLQQQLFRLEQRLSKGGT